MRLVPRIVLFALLGASCRELGLEPPPAAAYRSFATALAQGDAKSAWALLSRDTQAELTKEAQAVAKARNQPPPEDGLRLAFGERVAQRQEIKSIAITSEKDSRASLTVVDDTGRTQVIQVVREGEAWRVDLLPEIQKVQPR